MVLDWFQTCHVDGVSIDKKVVVVLWDVGRDFARTQLVGIIVGSSVFLEANFTLVEDLLGGGFGCDFFGGCFWVFDHCVLFFNVVLRKFFF